MSSELPYMMQMGNIPAILERIQEAGTPPKFTHEFLKNSLGFRGSGDRGVVKVLKQLKFLSPDSVPTQRYNEFRSKTTGGKALAEGLREGWSEIFLADQTAHEKTAAELTQIFKGVTGAGDASARKMAQTFKAFAAKADWSKPVPHPHTDVPSSIDSTAGEKGGVSPSEPPTGSTSTEIPIALHNDIHLHLPATSDVSVYRAIFRAVRDELRD